MDYSIWVQEIQQQERDQLHRQMIEQAQHDYETRLQQFINNRVERTTRERRPLLYLRDIESFPSISNGFLRKVYPSIGFLKNKFSVNRPWYTTDSYFDRHHRSYIDSILNTSSSNDVIRGIKCAYMWYHSLPKNYSFHAYHTCIACSNLQTHLRRYQLNKRKHQSRRTRKKNYRYFRLPVRSVSLHSSSSV